MGKKFIKDYGCVVIFFIICVIASIAIPRFLSFNNFMMIIKQASIPIIVCVAMTMVLMTGGIDLSLGYMIGLASIACGIFIKSMEMPIAVGILLTLLIGAAFGLLNGICIQLLHVPAFIATLGTGYIIYGIAQIISNGETVNHLPEAFLALGKTKIGPLTTTVLVSAVVCLIFYYVLHKSTFGRNLTAFGMNEAASRLSGVNTAFVNLAVYVISGVLSGIVGILLTIDVNCAQPTMGGGNYTFQVITGTVIGGENLYGGKGTIVGAIFGMLTLKVIANCIKRAL
jgi:ribose/xylose/arabinose/galactoside ABC-type transport system permease subunit